MKYDRILLISIDALSKKYEYLFEDYFTTKYDKYRSTATWTLPAHLNILCGIPFPKLFIVSRMKDYDKYKDYASNIPTIATLLRDFDFKSRAVTGGGFMSSFFGWGNDWDKWETTEDSRNEWCGEKILPKKNELLFLHTYYVHNWFHANAKMKEAFLETKNKLDAGLPIDQKKYRALLKEGEKEYAKRAAFLAKKLSWIKNINRHTLVILLSDHAELFFGVGSFHHGNLALKNKKIFYVPLLLKENTAQKTVVTDYMYDYLIPKLIFDKLELPFESVAKRVLRTNAELKNELAMIYHSRFWKLLAFLRKIKKNSLFFRWQSCRKQKLLANE
ncbi:MAG: hypothetical protein GYA62_09060 [Bacteroidales bacterium]|nr:hypothetical protein [Bacteroidales bacterium]